MTGSGRVFLRAVAAGLLVAGAVSPATGEGAGSAGPEADLYRLWQKGTDGNNEILAIVDGKPITTESIRAELEGTIETDIQTEMTLESARTGGRIQMTREQAEAIVIYRKVREKAASMIIRRIAEESKLTVSDTQLDSEIDRMKARAGISKDDLEAWADYTLRNTGKTPLKFRASLKGDFMEYQALELMAGMYGQIRGLELPVFIPREVSPSELLSEYQSTKDRWKVLSGIDYSLLAIGISNTASITTRQIADAALTEAARRLKNEPIAAVEAYLRAETERITDDTPQLDVLPSVQVGNDSELDDFGSWVRGLNPGDISLPLQHTKNEISWRFIVRLNSVTVGESRKFDDPVVQGQLKEELLQSKGMANKRRVRDALLERANVLPASLVGR